MEDKNRSEQELIDIAVELIKSLRPYCLTIREIRKVAEYMSAEADYIVYGP